MGNRLFSPGWQVVATSVLNQLQHKSDLRMPLLVSVIYSSHLRRLVTMNRRFLKLGSFCPKVIVTLTKNELLYLNLRQNLR